MFGYCVLIKKIFLIAFVAVGFTAEVWGQSPQTRGRARVTSQKGMIIVPEGTVFNAPSFDGQVISAVPGGQIFDISLKTRGPFYQIRIKPGVVGWISDAEVRPVSDRQVREIKEQKAEIAQQKIEQEKNPEPIRPYKELEERRFRGVVLENINFTEKTMGKTRKDSLIFYGLKFSGPNTVFDGPIDTDAELVFHSGAPQYYKKATGEEARGFILKGNFLFQSLAPQSKSMMIFYGFGPMFRFSHFEATLQNDPEPGKKRTYNLDDMTVGAVFNLGTTFALDPFAVRIEGRYYWETQQYTSFGLAIQKEF